MPSEVFVVLDATVHVGDRVVTTVLGIYGSQESAERCKTLYSSKEQLVWVVQKIVQP